MLYNENMTERDKARRYRKKKRALQEEETRLRITEALVQLHRTVGPASTKITEVAELAGVSRMTVYNHFPTETDLFQACSSHWASQNPFPDPSAWKTVGDPLRRLTTGLGELYRWYRGNADMLENVLRDSSVVSAVEDVLQVVWWPYVDQVVGVLSDWPVEAVGRTPETPVRLVVDFQTWRLLTAGVATDEEAAEMAAAMVEGAAAVRSCASD